MTFQKYNELFSLVANFAVVAGIVFLAIEVSQNTAQLDAQARATRASTVIDLRLWAGENSDLFLTGECTPKLRMWVQAVFELQMWQYLETGMPEYLVYRYHRYATDSPFTECMRQQWESDKLMYDPTFVAYMDQNVYQF